ncbi:VCBS repeat-containing protein [Cocleimonas sp. KMM 6892]|uniref:FG-GAP repeat domain-containing protein n=1 Tax=unclassified Cocleimonas TaxID=2639732 RepID=UPI002DBEACFD|nr:MULTISPECIES: VCBS repeat-containing protein [unclassified Cocleimonas]MEB8432656.1 VCBS repeat-containing protein [Cocleimonas sp. KMM 6892]MEC4715515.1 VCBS repeat-containing protein [Cocleimonas sp. KMM 6895]MEC4744867.1 VCBS repeat-containing protein [Cocleimonas sp. KMM 6896]
MTYKSTILHNPIAFTLLTLSTVVLSVTNSAEALPKTDFPESLVVSDAAKSGIQSAWYDEATTRYAHGVLGDAIEAAALHAKTVDGKTLSISLETAQVFEDINPRLADIDGDGRNEIITIRSHKQKGAQIAVYGIREASSNTLSVIASTPYIGQSHRWLAPVGIADFDNDGAMDIAYIDRPHLARILRVWSYRHGSLQQTAQKSGLTNHKIGNAYITGGVQRCGNQSSMITVDSSWERIIKTTLKNGELTSEDIGPYTGRASATAALTCR